jgi:hypothetical protein
MTPDTPRPGDESPVDDGNMGEPVVELRDLSLVVDDQFGRQVRDRIERHVLAGEFMGLAWTAPMMMLREFLRVTFELLLGKRRP